MGKERAKSERGRETEKESDGKSAREKDRGREHEEERAW